MRKIRVCPTGFSECRLVPEPRRWAVSVTWQTRPRSMHPQCREVVRLPRYHRGTGIIHRSRGGEGGTRNVGEQAFMRRWGTAFAFSFGPLRSRSGADRLIGLAQNSAAPPSWCHRKECRPVERLSRLEPPGTSYTFRFPKISRLIARSRPIPRAIAWRQSHRCPFPSGERDRPAQPGYDSSNLPHAS